jgi:type III secretion system YscQ/HrcQ family protein
MQHPPLAWARRIQEALPTLDEIPLFGNAPSFDWHRLSSLLASQFGIHHLSISPQGQEWRSPETLKKGLGRSLLTLPVALAPLGGHVFWIMSWADISKLTSWMLNDKAKTGAFSSEILQEGFYRYLALEVLNAIQDMQPLQELTLQLDEEAIAPETDSFCIDVEIGLGERSCWGRLVIPSELRGSWVRHFSNKPAVYEPSEIAKQTFLTVGIKTGSLTLQQDEWKKTKIGDFIALDVGSDVGVFLLETTPLFNVKIQQNKIELLDYAFYYEETMESKSPEPFESAEEGSLAIKELPLQVTVEIARLKMTLDQLMHLHPGNMLELPIHPEQGVSLTVNGQKVGRAELVYLGEQLGLRILEIG